MAPSRFVTGVLLALTVLALLPIAVVTGMALRHPALDSEPATPIDLDNDSMSFPRRMEVQEYMEAMIDPPLYCYTETNFDFVDSDVGNAPASAASQCCSLCHSANNCKAWSWSNFNGGTCWFKSQRSAVIYKPGVQSSLLFYSPQPTCVLQPNTAYAGNDIGSANYPAPSSCCQACKNFPKCRAFTFTNFNGGTCWFKSSNGNAVPAPGAVSAEVYPASVSDPPPTCDSTLKPGVDFFDHDIGNAPSPTAAGCCAICKGWKSPTQCRAFSWTNQNGGTCWLKSETGASVPNLNVISSTVIANPTPPCTIQFGADYFDNDIDNKPGANVFICCDVCKAYPGGGCKAYSWSNHNGGTCWLKGGKGTIIWNGNVHSGVVN